MVTVAGGGVARGPAPALFVPIVVPSNTPGLPKEVFEAMTEDGKGDQAEVSSVCLVRFRFLFSVYHITC